MQPTGLPEAYGGDRSIGQVRASATHLRHLLQRLVPDEQPNHEDPSQRSIRQDQDGGERVEPESDGRCLQDPHRAHGELHDPLLRTRGEADGADLRRRSPQVQANDPKHPRVRPQGVVVGLEVRRHTTNRGGAERPVLRERTASTHSGDEDVASGARLRQNEGDAGFEVGSNSRQLRVKCL